MVSYICLSIRLPLVQIKRSVGRPLRCALASWGRLIIGAEQPARQQPASEHAVSSLASWQPTLLGQIGSQVAGSTMLLPLQKHIRFPA